MKREEKSRKKREGEALTHATGEEAHGGVKDGCRGKVLGKA